MVRPSVFDALGADARQAVDGAGTVRVFDAGAYLCLEGEPSHSLYEIRSGLLRVERSTSDGRVVLLVLNGPGDLFGELGVLDGSPRSASAVAIEPVEALVIPSDSLQPLFEAHPQVLLAITRGIVSRLRDLTDQLVNAGERSIVARVATCIVDLVDRTNYADAVGPFSLPMPISQEELGQWVGLSREGTSKALRELRTAGILSTGRQRLEIHRIDRLRQVAAQSA